MPNAVSVSSEGFVEMTFEGDQSDEVLAGSLDQSLVHIKALRLRGQPVYIVADVRRLGKLTTTTRKFAVRTLMHIDYDKIAIFGANTFNKTLINLIAYAAGKSQIVQIFNTRQQAEEWLGHNTHG